jgi:adenine specific DNA methylase Mod
MNKLYFGDNLDILRNKIKDETVDLIYLDPPFNSQARYNVLFKSPRENATTAQAGAFLDFWSWETGESEDACHEIMSKIGGPLATFISALRSSLGESDMMAYLAVMALRLHELRRVLKPTGSIYLHCDPTASHYLKLLLDAVFGPANFVNELIWKRTTTKSDFVQGAKNWPRIHDTLLYYAHESRRLALFNQPFSEYSEAYVRSKYHKTDLHGRKYMLDNLTAPGAGSRGHPQYEFLGVTRFWRYNKAKMERLYAEGRIVQPSPGAVPRYKRFLDDMKGIAIGDCWSDISAINSQAKERIGYPTQKPLALLERVIEASSNKDDIVLDPFCGCGTTVEAAEKLGRQWIGIDVSIHAIHVIETRLRDAFGAARVPQAEGIRLIMNRPNVWPEQTPFSFSGGPII